MRVTMLKSLCRRAHDAELNGEVFTIRVNIAVELLQTLLEYERKAGDVCAWLGESSGPGNKIVRFMHPWPEKPNEGQWIPLYAGPKLSNVYPQTFYIPVPFIDPRVLMEKLNLKKVSG